MRLAAVVYSTDNPTLTEVAVRYLRRTVDPELTTIVVVDNGSSEPFPKWGDINIRYETNVGGNAVFHRWLKDAWFGEDPPEVLAFFHCDLFIHEAGWDQRVLTAFDADPELALLGFVGSPHIDELGGRGGGTMLNYAGEVIEGLWAGSPAEVHGWRMAALHPAAVLDHCSMIFRRTELEQLTPQEGTYAPEHFYDRILSCEVLERGKHIAVLGVSCDHFSGGIGAGYNAADRLRRTWLAQEGLSTEGDSFDAVYRESERRFFARYQGFFPVTVDEHHRVSHP